MLGYTHTLLTLLENVSLSPFSALTCNRIIDSLKRQHELK